nr:reverse transcriptase domain-containing protein [Tanacetum cinerariifolium]
SLNAAAGGYLLSKTTREALKIIKNKSKVRYSRNKSNVSRMNTTPRENVSKSDDRIDKLADQILTLVDIFAKKVIARASVKAVEESCVICGGAHAYYNCPNIDSNQPSVCVATGTYNQVAPQNRASNYMASPGFAPVQNGQNRFNQNHGQGNNFNQGIIFMFSISSEETIDSDFTRFNVVATSLKSLDQDYFSKNYVRKFLLALPLKWRAKVKSLALKAKVIREQTRDDSDSQGGSDEDVNEEEAESFN